MASTDRDALVALFMTTGGEGWKRNDNWDTDAELREWYGVEANPEGHVVKIDLHFNNLQGMPVFGLIADDMHKYVFVSRVVLDLPLSISQPKSGLPKKKRLQRATTFSLGNLRRVIIHVIHSKPVSLCVSFRPSALSIVLHRHTQNPCFLHGHTPCGRGAIHYR